MRKIVVILSGILVIQYLSPGFAQSNIPVIRNENFVAKILSPLAASTNQKGDKFTLQVLEPASYRGAIIEAEVTKAHAAGRVSGKSELTFAFEKLTHKNGTMIPITADLKEVTNSKGVASVDDEGHVIGKSSRKKDIARTAILGGIGAAIGGAAGGASGAAAGAGIGAAIGLAISFSTKGEDIKFSPGSQFNLVVNSKSQ